VFKPLHAAGRDFMSSDPCPVEQAKINGILNEGKCFGKFKLTVIKGKNEAVDPVGDKG
jgi:hypothetical protein